MNEETRGVAIMLVITVALAGLVTIGLLYLLEGGVF